VQLIPAGNPSAWTGPTGNNTYLLTGTVPTLIDAGVGDPVHLATLEQALHGQALAAVLSTHGHEDHIAGIPRLRERWPSVVVRNARPDACRDGEIIRAGDTELLALHTPGHAPDHFCFLDESTRDMYCGDLARLGGTVVIPASAGGSLTDYLASLRRIRALAPHRLLPGHGPPVAEPAVLIDEYLKHRADRERQIVAALRSGHRTLQEIVDEVYENLAEPLVRAARDSVHAHLIKLAAEGRAQEMRDGWDLT
jgi:glyoxylase-like metal-dependent hydrolase (beta-lactamase superfamily II)